MKRPLILQSDFGLVDGAVAAIAACTYIDSLMA